MGRRGVIIGLTLALLAPGLAQAEDKPPVKLTKVFPYLDKYLAIPPNQRDHFALGYVIQVDGKPAVGVNAAILEADGRRTPLAMNAEGAVTRLPTAAQLASASFTANAPPKADFGVHMRISPSLPPAQEYNPRDLELAVSQANAGMDKVAGMMRFAVPTLVGVSFPGAGSGKARLADGRETPLPLTAGAPFYDPKLAPGATKIVLAKAPTRLAFKDNK